MAEFLIKAQDSPVPDAPGKWYAAQIVTIKEDGHEWGGKEGPPKFYIIKIPGTSVEDATQYLESWRHLIDWDIVGSDASSDSYRLRLTSSRVSNTGKNAFTRDQVEGFITNWGGEIVSISNNQVTFDISVFDAATSTGLWGADVSSVVFVEDSYDQSTGNHVITIQNSPYTPAQMAAAIRAVGGIVQPPNQFIISRAQVRQHFQADIKGKVEDINYARRRWYITAAGMTALENSGGVLEITPAQFVANVRDGLDD